MACTRSLTYAQLQGLWLENGGAPAAAPVAAAIAMAESGGCVDATHHNSDGSTDTGLWQINSVNASSGAMLDPTANVKEAIALSNNGSSWHPWTTFTSGAYQRFLSGTPAAPSGITPSTTSLTGFQIPGPWNSFDPFTPGSNPLSSFSDVAKSITAFVKVIQKPFEYATAASVWLSNPHNWTRIAFVGVGVLVIAEGLHQLAPAAPSPVRLVVGTPLGAAGAGTKMATQVVTQNQRRATIARSHAERRATAEHATEQRITDREHRAATTRMNRVRPRTVNPAEEWF